MKLKWHSSPTISLLRSMRWMSEGGALKDASLDTVLRPSVDMIGQRLVTALIDPPRFWDTLIDEAVSAEQEIELSPRICEIALLRSGDSQLQSDQTAAAVFRGLDLCRRETVQRSPRLADQLQLRYAPLKQAFDAYGPGLIRSVGESIWQGDPPDGWWPDQVNVYAVTPLAAGASGMSSHEPNLWIEAMLTDVSHRVPEWLRLVYQISRLAIDAHTRSHSKIGVEGELPWSIGIVPMLLAMAADRGLSGDDESTLAEAVQLWGVEVPSTGATFDGVSILASWWAESQENEVAMPVILKQLAHRFAPSASAENP